MWPESRLVREEARITILMASFLGSSLCADEKREVTIPN